MPNTQYATVTIPLDAAMALTYILLRAQDNPEFCNDEKAAACATREAIFSQTLGK